ncbi:atp-dependent dna helicase recg [hydrocarbon metagenome]|uniref:ATP-dependent DNA helicase RecG n=1 Tax=hydrocarbon metagenome TaxID=938273 RepID=A0A0W8E7U8_9ZZZZ
MERLFQDIQYLKGIGPKRSQQFKRLGVENIFDLLWHVPRAYFNRGNPDKIKSLIHGGSAAVRGVVRGTHASRSRRGMNIFKAILQDDSGAVTAVWFNQPFLAGIITSGQEIFVSGKVKGSPGALELNVSEYEVLDESSQQIDVLPIYTLTEGLSQKALRAIMMNILSEYLPSYPDILSKEIKEEYDLCDIGFAFYNLHYPQDGKAYLRARRRLALEELLLFQCSLRLEQANLRSEGYVVHREKTDLVPEMRKKLPFELTPAQSRVVDEIYGDMGSPCRMNRLLQGDVGSGKTIVAALAMARAVGSGFQAAMMAPTEILAEQHYLSISALFAPHEVVVAHLTGSTPTGERRMILEALAAGEIDILVGTHALIQEEVSFWRLGLAVIDEQHRFGVKQRALLGLKGDMPDVLVMTATPIPRTLALTVYGDLSVSIIDEMPPGRKTVRTKFVRNSDGYRVYDFIRTHIHDHSAQAYIVCPLVEESENQDLIAAVTLYDELRNDVFSDIQVGLIHGRLKQAEKEYIMKRFKQGEVKVLVSTTVIEVGVDVPEATIMAVVHAERFGLSQLHQLRGRVGRGKKQSYCFLIGDPHTEDGYKRLKIMENTNDGFELAQHDLMIRGAGEFWGVKQHGLNQLKVANLVKDQKMMETSQRLVKKLNLLEYDYLERYINEKFKKNQHIAGN